MKVLIAGCGYLGSRLGAELAKSGHEVWGLRRDWRALRELEKETGIRAFPADLRNPDSLKNLPDADHVVLCQSPSDKKDSYAATYITGTENLLKALPKGSVRKIIQISSTSVYSTRDGSWVDERTDPLAENHTDRETGENAQILLAAEKLILSSSHPGTVFRLAGIYGPGRNRIKSLMDGRVKPVLSDTYMNRMHEKDIIRGIRLLFEKGIPSELYLGCDDHPCTQKEFYSWLYPEMRLPLPEKEEPRKEPATNKRCSNKKIRSLGLELRYPSYKEGYSLLIQEAFPRAAR